MVLAGLNEAQSHAGLFAPKNIALLVNSVPLSQIIFSGWPARRDRNPHKFSRRTAPPVAGKILNSKNDVPLDVSPENY
tara:strand:- start:27785 stop:28018 length:234 start_codon:yes stop_codon:yes gene_type:complete